MNTLDDSIFTLSLTRSAHQIAEQFRQQQLNTRKAKQVYLNTLAVQAVSSYLGWFGIETDLEASDSWNPMRQSLTDVADLSIPNRGKLECRPVLSGEQNCSVPADVQADRIGYVAVQFDDDLTQATLLGFVPSVNRSEVPLSELRSLDELFDYLSPASVSESTVSDSMTTAIANLSRWLDDAVDTGWQSIEQLFGMQQPAFSMRSVEMDVQTSGAIAEIDRGKPLLIGSYETGVEVALLIGILPQPNRERDIWIRVAPSPGEERLPSNLLVLILDEAGSVIMQAQARQTEMIQLRLTGSPGERFDVQLVIGRDSIVESFVI